MKRSSLCAVVLLGFLAGFAAVPPAAAKPRSGPARSVLASAFERLWSLVSIFQAKNGCEIDPNGVPRCEPAAATTTTENGCRIDPNGGCQP